MGRDPCQENLPNGSMFCFLRKRKKNKNRISFALVAKLVCAFLEKKPDCNEAYPDWSELVERNGGTRIWKGLLYADVI